MNRRLRYGLLGVLLVLALGGLMFAAFLLPRQEPLPQPTDETGQERLTFPDSDAPIPLEELSQDHIGSIVQVQARGEDRNDYCDAKNLRFRLGSFDAAAGSRFSQLVVVNDSSSTCLLAPIPGIGIVGSQGNRLKAEVTQSEQDVNYNPVPLEPFELGPRNSAWADIKWTGALAGSGTDHAIALAIQVGPAEDASLFIPPGEHAGQHPHAKGRESWDWGDAPLVDMGSGTTLQVSPWQK